MKRWIAIVLCGPLILADVAWAEGPAASIYDIRRSMNSGYDWTFSSSVEFATGRLDAAERAWNIYVPLTLQRNFPKGRVALTIPYIRQHTTVDIADREGRLYQINDTRSRSISSSGGLSDIILTGGYDLLRQHDGDQLDLSGLLKVKFSSADRARGLGTGAADQTIGLEALHRFDQEPWFVMGRAEVSHIGDPDPPDLNNELAVLAGVGYQWPQNKYASVSYEERTALTDDLPHSRSLIFNLGKPINEDADVTANITCGLSRGSMDFGIGIGTNIRF